MRNAAGGNAVFGGVAYRSAAKDGGSYNDRQYKARGYS
jgi:hypothetical protein